MERLSAFLTERIASVFNSESDMGLQKNIWFLTGLSKKKGICGDEN